MHSLPLSPANFERQLAVGKAEADTLILDVEGLLGPKDKGSPPDWRAPGSFSSSWVRYRSAQLSLFADAGATRLDTPPSSTEMLTLQNKVPTNR